VVGVIERYEQRTGRSAGAVSQKLLWDTVLPKLRAHGWPTDDAARDTLDGTLRASYKRLCTELAETSPTHAADRTAAAEQVATIADADIAWEWSNPWLILMCEALGVSGDQKAEQLKLVLADPTRAADIQAAKAQPDYATGRTAYRLGMRNRVIAAMADGPIGARAMETNITAFRTYLATHLPELLH